jgi:hypothetical protein
VTPSLAITAHCLVRARQRGYRPEDLAILERLGTMTDAGIFLRSRDVEAEVSLLKRQLQRKRHRQADSEFDQAVAAEDCEVIRQIERLQCLKGTFVPAENGHALSVYRPCRRREKRILLRKRRHRSNRNHGR